MTRPQQFDVVVVGGGLAGATLAGVLARAGVGVLLVEREARYRDRIRGEFTWPWGVAEAQRLGLEEPLRRAGCVALPAIQFYDNQVLTNTERFEGPPMIGFPHPALQEALFAWAAAGGAATLRPAKAVGLTRQGRPTVTVVAAGREAAYAARLVVVAAGKDAAIRRWTGGEIEADPEHHRFGGVLLTGLPDNWSVLSVASAPPAGLFWFARSAEATRLYARTTAARLRETRLDRSLDAFLGYAATFMPEGALDGATQAGPLGFFPNNAVWATRIAGDDVVLVGDAAGAVDPSWGMGTSLVFRDVRELRDVLLDEPDWTAAIAAFARRRWRYYDVVRAYDRWMNQLVVAEGPDAERRRERHARARERDPTLGGFALLEIAGPDGLVPDEAARRHFFGDDLADTD